MSDKGQTFDTFEVAIGRERQHALYCKACPGPCRGHEANVHATDAAHRRELAEAEARGVRKGRAEAFRETIEHMPGFAGDIVDAADADILRQWLEQRAAEEEKP